MSLSRILNDTPSSPIVSANSISRLLNDDPAPIHRPSSSSTIANGFTSHSPKSPAISPTSNGPAFFGSLAKSGTQLNEGVIWSSRHGGRSKGELSPSSPHASFTHPADTQNDSPTYVPIEEGMTTRSRKRRRTSEHLNDAPRRVTRHAAKTMSQDSTKSHSLMDQQYSLPYEDVAGPSSDLEDCPALWHDELGRYILETYHRERGIEAWYELESADHYSHLAHSRSDRYISRISSFPTRRPQKHKKRGSPSLDAEFDSAARSGDEMSGVLNSHFQDDAAEDAARVLEESLLGRKGKRALYSGSEDSDFDVPLRTRKPSSKRRKHDDVDDITDELERSVADDNSRAPTPSLKLPIKRGRIKPGDDLLQQATKRGKRKKLINDMGRSGSLGLPGQASSMQANSENGTPFPSAPPSPDLRLIYELSEAIPPLKRPQKKLDGNQAVKRIKAVEDAQQKVWATIARKEIPKVFKFHVAAVSSKEAQHKRLAHLCLAQSRKPHVKTAKSMKETSVKSKRVMRDMLVFWRKNEKEERDGRRRAEKEAVDRAKEEEEKREAARQARKLEFLISQTELYSHFVGNKLKTSDAERVDSEGGSEAPLDKPFTRQNGMEPEAGIDPTTLRDIDFDDDDESNLRSHATHNAQEAIAAAKRRAELFDKQTAIDRKAIETIDPDNEGLDEAPSSRPLVDLDSDELNFQNPTSLKGQLSVAAPKMLMAQLKEYQLKGLNWLATLYEQGINGILADEMGLGKTVQSISLMAYLAEVHDIWGPFLVIAPASTLHNWQQELSRFVPGLKALPYWGNVKDRAVLRKFWNRKQIRYDRDASFHVLITSYQLVLADEKYFQRVKWQYMILDEAQNIKNSSSARWKTLLSFHCRNRLLLTGTPIQNSMHELWALLHFIMPTLFDSHDEFSEWFSKDIENAAENKGSKLNEHQLRRLHMILKPFMLRRIKRHVQNELSEKIEIDIYCDLSFRQRVLYRGLRANVSVKELLEKAANIGDADSARSLMNLVMQFRKVCNHPELFERADVIAPYSFCHFGGSDIPAREGDTLYLPYSSRNPITYSIPVAFCFNGGLLDIPSESSQHGSREKWLRTHLSIWGTDWIYGSACQTEGSAFSFISLLDRSPSQIHSFCRSSIMSRLCFVAADGGAQDVDGSLEWDDVVTTNRLSTLGRIRRDFSSLQLDTLGRSDEEACPQLHEIRVSAWAKSCLSRPRMQWLVRRAVAPPIKIHCALRTFVDAQVQLSAGLDERTVLYGLSPSACDSTLACRTFNDDFPHVWPTGLLHSSPQYQTITSTMQVPDAKRLIYDSAKLARLDLLLQELKAGDHKVLIYFQMTKMMDLMEEYLIFRQHKYLRLDGSSKLEDRRDMVIDWQTRPDIFVFILSTRAGGLGINLTAADTVVFYDHDWNPSNDSQAMDRAHRLGQTRQVTVYRLITKGTIDERIIQLARVKKDVQDIVVGNKQLTDVAKPSEIVSLLLNDDELANLGNNDSSIITEMGRTDAAAPHQNGGAAQDDGIESQINTPRDLWDDDDYSGAAGLEGTKIEDEAQSRPSTSKGRRKNRDKPPAKRGRKPGSGKGLSHKRKPGPVTGDTLPQEL